MNLIEQRIDYYKHNDGAIDLYPAEFRNLMVRELQHLLYSFAAIQANQSKGGSVKFDSRKAKRIAVKTVQENECDEPSIVEFIVLGIKAYLKTSKGN